MSIAARCPQCAQSFSAPDKLAGKRVKCPTCSAAVAIGPPATPAPPPIDTSLVDLLDDKLTLPDLTAHYAAAAPATLRPAPVIEAKVVKHKRPSQLKRHAPALEILGVLIAGCGLFGLFAFFALHYTPTWRDLGSIFLFGGCVIFGLAQILDFDGERCGRAVGVLFFFCVIAASIGGGIEVASGRINAGSLMFWAKSEQDVLLEEADALDEEMREIILRMHDVATANQLASELRAVDQRIGEFMKRVEKSGHTQVFLSRREHETRQKKVAANTAAVKAHFSAVLASPNGRQAVLVIANNMPNAIKLGEKLSAPGSPDSLAFNRLNADAQAQASNPPTIPQPSPFPRLAPPFPPASSQPLSAFEEHQRAIHERHKEMADRMKKQSEDVRTRFGTPGSIPAASPSPSFPDAGVPTAAATARPSVPSAPPQERGLRGKADSSFRFHEDAVGQAYLQAAAVAGSDEALKPQLQWCPALKRPAFSLYWGIGVSLEALADAPEPDARWKNVRRPLDKREHRMSFSQIDNFKKRTGDVGEGLAQGIQSRIDQRAFGDWGSESERSRSDLRGLVMFDVGPLGWSLQQAREQAVDVLVMLHLQDKRSAAGAYTELQINILKVSDGKSLWHSEVLSDRKLKNERRKGKDPAADLVASAFTFIDKELRLTKMPTVKPEVARKRAAKVCADLSIEPIAAVLEVRYFQVQGLLTADEARELYEKKVGADAAEALATGDELQRETALAAFLSQ